MPEYQTMTEMAATELRKAIMRGDLPPGTRLIPNKLEGELNLSRVAIREAIRELAGSGLVETVTNVGAHVTSPPSFEEMKEIFEIRLAIEPKLALKSAEKITDRDIELLQKICRDIDNQKPPGKDFFFLNRTFHQTLYRISGWIFLCGIVSQFMDQILIFRSIHYSSRFDFRATNLEHKKLIAKIKEGDTREIKNLVKSHLKRGLEDLAKATS